MENFTLQLAIEYLRAAREFFLKADMINYSANIAEFKKLMEV